MGAERGSYGQSGSSSDQMPAHALYQQRKNYGRAAGVMGEVSEYRMEVSVHSTKVELSNHFCCCYCYQYTGDDCTS